MPPSPPHEHEVDPLREGWRIHGAFYDLQPFIHHHPGGSQLLLSVRGTDDLTAIFESSHAFASRSRIERVMAKYRVGACEPSSLRFPDDSFYRDVIQRVRAALPNGVRATPWWCVKASLLVALWASCFLYAFLAAEYASLTYRCAIALIAGHVHMAIGFVVMHDASHSAISSSPRINFALSWFWNTLSCWDYRLWHKHHVFRHHSFTGDTLREPDTVHLTPFLRKHLHSGKRPIALSRMAPFTSAVLFVSLLPGMFVGQSISYARWWMRGRLWRMDVVKSASLDIGACVLRCLLLLLYAYQPHVALAYLSALNATYSICILPDHDSEGTRASAKVASRDWGEEQVRNSANFATRNPLVCALYGGINFQIEHHLFPTLCHVHYPTIQPVVREACREYGIPYNDYPTVASAYLSALRVIAEATVA